MKLTILDKALGLPLNFEFNYALSGYFQVGQVNFEDISSVFAIVERLYVHYLRLQAWYLSFDEQIGQRWNHVVRVHGLSVI